MASPKCETDENTVVIGSRKPNSFWLWTAQDGYDLTRRTSPSSPPIYPRVKLHTTNSPVTIHPSKTALIIIDMQNWFLSTAVGRSPDSPGHKAEKALLDYAIPAARRARIQVVWLNWGVSDEELESMPPTMLRIFQFRVTHGQGEILSRSGSSSAALSPSKAVDKDGDVAGAEDQVTNGGIGCSIGDITLEDGTVFDGGRLLMKGSWNARLHPPLEAAYKKSLGLCKPDILWNKDRLWGMSSSMGLSDYLKGQGFTTLLFAGVNTDQCVLSTMQDAVFKGWDCILLKDGCGTSSPDFARQATEFNSEKIWGFVSTCEELKRGVEATDFSV